MRKKVKLNAPLKNYKVGDVVELEFDGELAVDKYWRSRFIDAKIDNCVELVEEDKAVDKNVIIKKEVKNKKEE